LQVGQTVENFAAIVILTLLETDTYPASAGSPQSASTRDRVARLSENDKRKVP
jgi:hypothetical protein